MTEENDQPLPDEEHLNDAGEVNQAAEPGPLGELAIEGHLENAHDESDAPDANGDDNSPPDLEGSEKALMFHGAMETLLHQAERVEESGEPWGASLAKELREEGVELGAMALEQLEKEKNAFSEGKKFVVGRLLAIASGELETENGAFLLGFSNRGEDLSGNNMTREQVERLRNEVYALLGVPAPTDEQLQDNSGGGLLDKLDDALSGIIGGNFVHTESPETGLVLYESRHYVKVGKLGHKHLEQTYLGLYVGTIDEQKRAEEKQRQSTHA